MHLKITANYPHEEIISLVEFAAKNSKADLGDVAVNVKNCSSAYAGMAYEKVPRISNAPPEAKRLVTLRIGPHYKFPKTNMVKTYKWEKRPQGEYARSKQKHLFRGCGKMVDGKYKTWMEKKTFSEHPYGGKKSPLITMGDWQEALIVVAAHEFNHIYQYQYDLPRSEIECEKAALFALEEYRKVRA